MAEGEGHLCSAPTARRYFRAVAVLCVLSAFFCAGCDLDWKDRAERQYQDASMALSDGFYENAHALFRKSLESNPFHPMANRMLAELLDTRLRQEGLALVYYRRYLDLQPKDADDVVRVKDRIKLLEEIRAGRLEDPEHAVEDLVWAAVNGESRVWLERLSARCLALLSKKGKAPEEYRETWKTLVQGKLFVLKRALVQPSVSYVILRVDYDNGETAYWKLDFRLPESGRKLWELETVDRVDRGNALQL